MIDFKVFIQRCEKDLISNRTLGAETLDLLHSLPGNYKILCRPILEFIIRRSIEIETIAETDDVGFSPEERILVCRLLPLYFALDTGRPTYSSYMLTQSIAAATSIKGIKLIEIGIGFLEVFCEFSTPLNDFVYQFCENLGKEFVIYFKERIGEFNLLHLWEDINCLDSASVAFLRWVLLPHYFNPEPQFVLKTLVAILPSSNFAKFANRGFRYIFEDDILKHKFLECLSHSDIPEESKTMLKTALFVD